MTEPLVPETASDPGFEGLDDDLVAVALAKWGQPEATDQPADEPVETAPETDEPSEGDETSEGDEPEVPSPLDAPAPESAPDVVTLPDGRQVPVALVTQLLDSQTPAAPPAPALPQTDAVGLQIPPVSEEDLELLGPAGQAIIMLLNAQAQRQQQLEAQLGSFQEQRQQQATQEFQRIALASASQFARTYQLPDDLMEAVRDNVEDDDFARELKRSGDPYRAVEYALERSYATLPQAQTFDRERRADQMSAAETRKRKLAGVGGSGGTAPRNTVDLSTEQGRRQAAIAEVAAAMGIHE